MAEKKRDPSSAEIKLLHDLQRLIDQRTAWYSGLEVSFCVARKSGEMRAIAGLIRAIPAIEEPPPPLLLDYGHIALSRTIEPVAALTNRVTELISEQSMTLPPLGRVMAECQLTAYANTYDLSYYRKESRRQWGYANSIWPYYIVEIRAEQRDSTPEGPLVKAGLPVYPNWSVAAHRLLGIGNDDSQPPQMRMFPIVIPDPRARIDQIVLRGAIVTIRVVAGTVALPDLLVKAYASAGSKHDATKELAVTGPDLSLTFDFAPTEISVHLLSRSDGDGIDHRDLDLRYGWRYPDVFAEKSDDELLSRLRMGESETVEYKEYLDEKGTKNGLTKVVAAFANSRGGVVFVGVDDEGTPKASAAKGDEDRIRQVLTEQIEPLVRLEFQRLDVGAHRILAVIVPEGTEKPYVVRHRGVFVRDNATSRPATRGDFDRMQKQQSSRLGGF